MSQDRQGRGKKHARGPSGSESSSRKQETEMKKLSPDRRETTTGILRMDFGKPRRSSGGSVDFRGVPDRLAAQVEPVSPQPSIDRLSVTFAEKSDCSESSVKVNVFDPGSPPSQLQDKDMVRFSREEGAPEGADEEEEDDYSASVSVIMQRRESTRRSSSKRRKRRPSSPFSGCDGDSELFEVRRRSSVYTNSSGETGMSEEGTTQEQIFENIKLHKEVLSSVKLQPWNMRRKIKLVQQAKSYVKRHEGELQERLAMSKSTKDILARFNILLVKKLQFLRRELANTMTLLIPWELRIKEIESHFGSAVASYFTFLRWMFWVNLVITIVLACFVAIPEMLTADAKNDGERKELLPEEKQNATNLLTLWDFEGVLKYSPIFYGYYTNKDKTSSGYRLPFAYFMTGLAVYVYSFVATLRRMAENSRMSKLSEKEDECVFTWKLFSGWDYMIGNAETAHNRVASLILGFKEVLLEETERKKDEKNWKVTSLRILVNLLVLGLLVISAYIIFIVVERSTMPDAESTWWRQNEITVSLSIISIIFPIMFELLGLMESYHPRKCLRIQLARIMLLNLLNLYTLIFSLFWKISDKALELKALKTKYKIPDPETFDTTSALSNTSTSVSQWQQTDAVTEAMASTCRQVLVNCSMESQFPGVLGTTFMVAALANVSMTTLWPPVGQTSPSLTAGFSSFPSYQSNFTEFDYDLFENDTLADASEIPFNFTEADYPSTISPTGNSFESPNPVETATRRHSTFPYLFTVLAGIVKSSLVKDATKVAEEEVSSTETEETTTETSTVTDRRTERTTTESETDSDLEPITEEPCYVTVCDASSTEAEATPGVTDTATARTSTEAGPRFDLDTRRKLRMLCWETMFGQELVKLTVMDLVLTVVSILLLDFFRAVFVRVMNNCWCWDLEKKFPQYGDFKIAENILHLVHNQGIVWMGMFFSPGLPAINLIKLAIMMYLRSWAVLTCNVPHEVVFKASRSNNFYLALLLTMLFLCVLPVGFAIVWIEPSWHCGPFSDYKRIYHLFTKSLEKALPKTLHKALDYVASPSIIIPLLMLLVLIIYYLVSLTNSLREANNDLKVQLRRERTEERRKMFQLVDKRARKGSGDSETPFAKWKKLLPDLSPKPSVPLTDVEKGDKLENGDVANVKKEFSRKELLSRLMKKALRKSSGTSDDDSHLPDDNTDGDQPDSLFDEHVTKPRLEQEHKKREVQATKRASGHQQPAKVANVTYEKERVERNTSVSSTQRNSLGSDWSDNIPVIKISKTESSESILQPRSPRKSALEKFRTLVDKQIKKQRKEKERTKQKNKRSEEVKKIHQPVERKKKQVGVKSTDNSEDREAAKRRVKEKLKKLGKENAAKETKEETVGKKVEVAEVGEVGEEDTNKRCPIATAETLSSDLDMSLASLKTADTKEKSDE